MIRQFNNRQAIGNPFYKTNMETLKMYYPEIARLIAKTPANVDYETLPTKSGVATLRIKSKDFYYYDREDPIREIDKHLKQYKPMSAPLAVFLGFGIGNEVIRYMNEYSQPLLTMNIVIIEKDPALFQLAMKTLNLVEIIKHKQVKIMVGEPIENLFAIFEKYLFEGNKYLFLRGCKAIYSNSAMELHGDYYSAAWMEFKKAAHYSVMNYGNDPKDSLVGVENMLDNLELIVESPGINLLKNKFCGKPAVVVSTGASLDKNKHLLKGLNDKAVIIAADSALKPLLKDGLKPHMVTALEREHEIELLFKDIPREELTDIYLAGCPVLYNHVYQSYKGPNIIVYRKFDHFKWLQIDRGMLDIKSSAGNMAFKVAEYLGCNPIILIGQDLALTRDGKTNAGAHVLGAEQNSYLKEARFTVMGNDGKPIETTASLKLFLDSYNIDVASYKGKCINATEGGAYINGTEVMTFQQAIDKYIQNVFNPIEIIRENLGQFTPSYNECEKVSFLIQNSIKSFKNIVDLCEKGLNLYDGFAEELKSLKENPNSERITFISEQFMQIKSQVIGSDPFTWQLFFAHIAQGFYLNHEIEMFKYFDLCESPELARVEIALRQREWFEIIKGLTEVCIKTLEKTREEVQI